MTQDVPDAAPEEEGASLERLARAVARAFQMAQYLPVRSSRRLRVLVLSAKRQLITMDTVAGPEQAALVAEQLAALRFERAPVHEQVRHECDLLLVQSSPSGPDGYTRMLDDLPSSWPLLDTRRDADDQRDNSEVP